jgi:tRNA G46 methylase TrmB
MTHLHRILRPGGMLHFATDDRPYLATVRTLVEASGFFDVFPEGMSELQGLQTDFEARWLAQGKPVNIFSGGGGKSRCRQTIAVTENPNIAG